MKIHSIKDNISYLSAYKEPLSAEVFKITGKTKTWFFDVGSHVDAQTFILNERRDKGIVISHFHQDHMGNLETLLNCEDVPVFLGENSYRYIHRGNVVCSDLWVDDDIHVFPIPASHAKGSLGLEIGDYAFLGDAIYRTQKKGKMGYNVQLLKAEMEVLKKLKAKYFVISHGEPLVREKEAVLMELQQIYEKREKNEPFIYVND